jgi:hypothetical protein
LGPICFFKPCNVSNTLGNRLILLKTLLPLFKLEIYSHLETLSFWTLTRCTQNTLNTEGEWTHTGIPNNRKCDRTGQQQANCERKRQGSDSLKKPTPSSGHLKHTIEETSYQQYKNSSWTGQYFWHFWNFDGKQASFC